MTAGHISHCEAIFHISERNISLSRRENFIGVCGNPFPHTPLGRGVPAGDGEGDGLQQLKNSLRPQRADMESAPTAARREVRWGIRVIIFNKKLTDEVSN